VGARTVLVLTGYGLGEWEYRRATFEVTPDHVAGDLLDAVEWTLAGAGS
jgi:D-glycero-D-manno-heptose 1,7-bisphosphate phosphatase